ncbi:odorant receptor 2a-like [Anabrus simplex]|uniref:odorant receptor 2a-like n=1 Tax=Anabrus simplex TaxID=316456 RepID=UPI0034DCEE2F
MLMVSMGGLISGALTQLGMFCYFGDQVQEESEAVAFAAYSAQWYHATPSVKRSIGIIMSRSQKPAILTMGKFADLSLDTFATILRGSYAYFAMLNELNS